MNTRYTSNALWPKGVLRPDEDEVTTDTHETRKEAEAVCRLLAEQGFGGSYRVFPIRTWVELVARP